MISCDCLFLENMTKEKHKTNRRTQSLLNLGLFAGLVIFINILANARFGNTSLYGYLDLTEEKRFTLTDQTKNLLRDLDEVVYVKILLDGDFPAGFKRLQSATRELLEDFRGETGYIDYDFENPLKGTPQEINEQIETLRKNGTPPIPLRVEGSSESSEQLICPYAVVNYKGRSTVVSLLENQTPGTPQEVVIRNSLRSLEYKFVSSLDRLRNPIKPVIAFSTGHGELEVAETADIEKTLRQYYETGRLNMDSLVNISQELSLLIVAKPRAPFSEKDKFKLDQYIMNGGKVLWLIDKLNIDLDSLRGKEEFFPMEYDLQLDDLLFRYGARIQPNMILDLQCSRIALTTGMMGNAAQVNYFRYPYHPVVAPSTKHPVVKTLDLLNFLYPSTIDTIKTKTDINKTVLLATSEKSRMQYIPIGMNFEFLRYDLDPTKFDKKPQALALLLEGVFPSLYENRVSNDMLAGLQQMNMEFKNISVPNKMIVISDGDIAKNKIDWQNRSVIPLGYNEFDRFQFANKDLLINSVEYLLGDRGFIEARGKDVKIRLLNTPKAKEEKVFWQLLNIVAPLVLLVVFGFIYNWIRRRRFA